MKLLNKFINNNITFEKITEEWLSFKKHSVKESTYFRYKYVVQTYLIKNFKDIKLLDLKNYDFNNYVGKLAKSLSKKTVLDIITILKSILKYCERKYDMDFKLDLISSLKKDDEQVEILTNSEFQKLEKYCLENLSFKNLGILICLYTGIRIGELCALQWKNIDLHQKQISINKTMQRIYVKGEKSFISIDTPKSKKSTRNIPITNKILSLLKTVKSENKFEQDAYFLTGSKSNYIEPRNMQYHFESVLQKCGIKKYHFHVLRHTFASRCIQVGMDVKSLSEILGHSSVNITLNKYVHPSLKSKTKFLDKL